MIGPEARTRRFSPAAAVLAHCLAAAACDGNDRSTREQRDAAQPREDAGTPEQPFSLRSSQSWPVCRLVGPANRHPGIYGTDLGFAFLRADSSELVLLFGDTETTETSVCDYPPRTSDDMQASLPAERPDVLQAGEPGPDAEQACAELQLPESATADPTAWPPIRVFADRDAAEPLNTSLGRTPVTGFSDGEHAFMIFLRGEHQLCEDSTQCPSGMACSSDPNYTGLPIGLCDPPLQVTSEPGPMPCLRDGDCGPKRSCALPGPGRCLATEPFRSAGPSGPVSPPWYDVDPRRGVAQAMYIASAPWPERPADYVTGHRFVTNRFVNVAARTVAHFDPDDPSKNDYRPGTHTLLLWGRSHFLARLAWQPLVFLLYQPLAGLLGADSRIAWAPRYFAGYREDGRPRWSEVESEAFPIYGADTVLGPAGTEQAEFGLVNQMSVTWVAPLERWVMFYAGSLPGFLFYDPATDMEVEPTYRPPVKGAMYVRTAAHPWGRAHRAAASSEDWSTPEPVLTRETAAPYLGCPEPPQVLPGCTDEHDLHRPLQLLLAVDEYLQVTEADHAEITRSCLQGDALRDLQYMLSGDASGHLYGASILEPWTADVSDELTDLTPGERAVELYWNVSAWNPYQVVLVKTQLRARVP